MRLIVIHKRLEAFGGWYPVLRRLSIALILVVLFSGLSFKAEAQQWVVSGMAESTIKGGQYGVSSGYLAKKSFMIELFYQQGTTRYDEWPDTRNTLYGIQTLVPVFKSEKINFSVFTRIGLANENFVVFIPGTETTLHVNKVVGIGTGFNWRYGHPSIHGRLLIKI